MTNGDVMIYTALSEPMEEASAVMLDGETGEQRWALNLTAPIGYVSIVFPIAISDLVIAYRSVEGAAPDSLTAYQAATGEVVWSVPYPCDSASVSQAAVTARPTAARPLRSA